MRQLAADVYELHVLVNVNYEDQGVIAARRMIDAHSAGR